MIPLRSRQIQPHNKQNLSELQCVHLSNYNTFSPLLTGIIIVCQFDPFPSPFNDHFIGIGKLEAWHPKPKNQASLVLMHVGNVGLWAMFPNVRIIHHGYAKKINKESNDEIQLSDSGCKCQEWPSKFSWCNARLICAGHLNNSVKLQAELLFQNLIIDLSDIHDAAANKDKGLRMGDANGVDLPIKHQAKSCKFHCYQ